VGDRLVAMSVLEVVVVAMGYWSHPTVSAPPVFSYSSF
jgi:hypothetical protein